MITKLRLVLLLLVLLGIKSAFGQTPNITSFNPSSGPVGTLVTIYGTNLNYALNFTIGYENAIVISKKSTAVVVMVMPNATTGPVSASTADSVVRDSSRFAVIPTNTQFGQQGAKLVANGSAQNDQQGFSAAVSADGNTAIVGAPFDNNYQGCAWVYTRNGGVWTQQSGKLVGTGGIGNSVQEGYSVAISADGNTAIIGGSGDNAVGYSPNGVGAAWIFVRTGTTWTQQGPKLLGTGAVGNGRQGWAVSISADGNTAMVAGPQDNPSGNTFQGAVWVYTRTGTTWAQQGNKLVASGNSGGLGESMSLSADGKTAIFGGGGSNSAIGAGFVFSRSGNTWNQQAELVGSNDGSEEQEGYAVAISADGNTAIIGGPDDNNFVGAAWVFTRSGSVWSQQGGKLVNSEASSSAGFATAVSLSADGNTAMIGASNDNTYQGAVWVFARNNGVWAQQGSKLVGSGIVGQAQFGLSVSVSADGNTAIMGGVVDNSYQGAAWVFSVPSNANLSALKISKGTLSPAFAMGTNRYTASVANSISSITVSPTTVDPTAIATVNGAIVASGTASAAIPLLVGTNTIATIVTGQDHVSTKTYAVTVTRAPSTNANLSTLGQSIGGLTPAFSSTTTSYTESVSYTKTSITLKPVSSDANATIKVNGTEVTSGTTTAPIALSLGDNSITTVVTAQDGVTTKTYILTVTRALSNVAYLSNLKINTATLSPAFASKTLSYTSSVPNTTVSVTITPTLLDTTASSLTVNGIHVANKTASMPILLAATENAIQISVIAQDGKTSQNYLIAITRAPSTNATLSDLQISSGVLSPAFASGTIGYAATVATTTTSITVTPTADTTAFVTVNGKEQAPDATSEPINLAIGANTITIAVTAQDRTTNDTYTLTVTREAAGTNNANLSTLGQSAGGLTPTFASSTTSYTEKVSNATATMTLKPVSSDPNATIKVNGTAVTSGTITAPIALTEGGQTVITTVVTAQDGTTTKTYTLTVTRAPSSIATLANLQPGSGTLSPSFASSTVRYTDSVANALTTITVTPTTTDAGATVTVNGVAVTTGTASVPFALHEGASIVLTTVVTSQDGTATKTYTLTVTRDPSTNAGLSGIKLSNGTLSPAFAEATTIYTAGVANTVSSITITSITADTNATIKVNGTAVTSGMASTPIALAEGAQTTITAVVTAQDGVTTKTYTVTVTRAPSTNANLSTLGQSVGGLTPAFSPATTGYTDNVSNTTASITLKPVSSDANATIKVNGTAVASGTMTAPIALSVGSNTITTIVTAQNGTTTKTYTLTVTRAAGAVDSYNPGISVTRPTEAATLADDGIQVNQGVSPNGDCINDFLQIKNISQYPDNKLTIMNRNGQLVYEATGYDNSSKLFDGHSSKNGQMQLPGTYFYQLDYIVKGITKHKTGFIVLKY